MAHAKLFSGTRPSTLVQLVALTAAVSAITTGIAFGLIAHIQNRPATGFDDAFGLLIFEPLFIVVLAIAATCLCSWAFAYRHLPRAGYISIFGAGSTSVVVFGLSFWLLAFFGAPIDTMSPVSIMMTVFVASMAAAVPIGGLFYLVIIGALSRTQKPAALTVVAISLAVGAIVLGGIFLFAAGNRFVQSGLQAEEAGSQYQLKPRY